MRKNQLLILVLILFTFSGCAQAIKLDELTKFAATEIYPDDTYLDTVKNKRALIIVAHDDDDCTMAGTIAKLCSKGWFIKQYCLQNHIDPKTGQNPSNIICQGSELIYKGKFYRRGMDTIKMPYFPISYAQISEQYFSNELSLELKEKINEYNPSIIITLDDSLGGYGHPDHIFISHLVRLIYNSGEIKANRIYQSVYTKHMQDEIINKWLAQNLKKWKFPNTSAIACEMYNIDGMPKPNVQINVFESAEVKMKYLRAYDESVRKNIRKFIPYYERFNANDYFKLFDREFFKVVQKN